jgi:hypothetical protein
VERFVKVGMGIAVYREQVAVSQDNIKRNEIVDPLAVLRRVVRKPACDWTLVSRSGLKGMNEENSIK